jgi:hypothetical protein
MVLWSGDRIIYKQNLELDDGPPCSRGKFMVELIPMRYTTVSKFIIIKHVAAASFIVI